MRRELVKHLRHRWWTINNKILPLFRFISSILINTDWFLRTNTGNSFLLDGPKLFWHLSQWKLVPSLTSRVVRSNSCFVFITITKMKTERRGVQNFVISLRDCPSIKHHGCLPGRSRDYTLSTDHIGISHRPTVRVWKAPSSTKWSVRYITFRKH